MALIMAANPLRRRRKTAAARRCAAGSRGLARPRGILEERADDVGDAGVRAVGVVAAGHDHVHLRRELRERCVAQRRRGDRIRFSGDRERRVVVRSGASIVGGSGVVGHASHAAANPR